MAVTQGARVHATALPARRAALPRGSAHAARIAARRMRPAAMVIGVILAATLLGLVYLTQTLHAAATRVEIERLLERRALLQRELRSQESVVLRWSAQPAVTQWAQNRGLDDLGATLILGGR
jgi:hypothetical protein